MTYYEIKEWLRVNDYQNSGLRTNENHRIDLYLSDVLFDFAKQNIDKENKYSTIEWSDKLKSFINFADFAKEEYSIHIPINLIKEYIKIHESKLSAIEPEITKEYLFDMLKKTYDLIPDGTESEDLIEIKKILFTALTKIKKEVKIEL